MRPRRCAALLLRMAPGEKKYSVGFARRTWDTRRTPFPLLVAAGLQWKGGKGQADCDVWRSRHRPCDGAILGLFCRARTVGLR